MDAQKANNKTLPKGDPARSKSASGVDWTRSEHCRHFDPFASFLTFQIRPLGEATVHNVRGASGCLNILLLLLLRSAVAVGLEEPMRRDLLYCRGPGNTVKSGDGCASCARRRLAWAEDRSAAISMQHLRTGIWAQQAVSRLGCGRSFFLARRQRGPRFGCRRLANDEGGNPSLAVNSGKLVWRPTPPVTSALPAGARTNRTCVAAELTAGVDRRLEHHSDSLRKTADALALKQTPPPATQGQAVRAPGAWARSCSDFRR